LVARVGGVKEMVCFLSSVARASAASSAMRQVL
jgi:hypothetical protein